MNTYINPMEWVGEAHNAGVRWVIKNHTWDPKEAHEQALTKIEKLTGQYFGAVGFVSRDRRLLERHPDTKSMIEVLEKKGTLTTKGAQTVSKLFVTIQKKIPLRTLLAEIEQEEHAAVGNLAGHDLIFFQVLATIARHSAKLWAPVEQGGEGFPHGVSGVPSMEIDWKEVLFADAVAGLGGADLPGAVFASLGDWLWQSLR